MALALTSLTFNFNVFLQGISSHIQPWLLLLHYPHLLLFHHQDFKLQNSLGPQTLIPFLIPATFFLYPYYGLQALKCAYPNILLCLGFTCLFPSLDTVDV